MIETGSALLIVLALISLLRFVLTRSGVATGQRGVNSLDIIESRALTSKQRICLVEVEGRRFLLGSSDAGITMLARLGAPSSLHNDLTTRASSEGTCSEDLTQTRPKGRWVRLSRSLRGLAFLAIVFAPTLALAGAADPTPALSIGLSGLTGPEEISKTLEIVALMTLVSIAPSLLLMATCFTRIVIVLAFLRQAIGLQQLPPNQVLVGLALFTSLFVMAPVGEQIRADAYVPYVANEIDASTAAARAAVPVRRFLFAHTREADLDLFVSLRAQSGSVETSDVPLTTILPAFMISELRTAFEIGFLIYLPFLVIDLVIASMLISMGMIVLPPIVISLPFKLMLFVLMDGWNRVISSLVTGLQY